MDSVRIRTEFHEIGSNFPPYIIAEIGLNHNGNLDLAFQMVDAAAACGVQAAKFQLFDSDHFIEKEAALGDGGPGSLREFFRQFELSRSGWKELAAHCRKRKVDFLCSVFDRPSLDFYATLSPFAIKIASCDINNKILIEDTLQLDLPLLISTGTASESEVEQTVRWTAGHAAALFQCVSSYPASPSDYNIRAISAWISKYNLPVGISDHCPSNAVSLGAVALGACMIEKHFTLDRKMDGPDHSISSNPEEFAALVKESREVFESLGDGIKKACASEEAPRLYGRRSLYAALPVASSAVLERRDMEPMRPGGGIAPDMYEGLVGKKTRRSIDAGEKLSGEMFFLK